MSPPSEWSRDESRYVDGELDAANLRRLEQELERQPERAQRLDAWEEAMDLWRDEAARQADAFDGSAMSQAVLAGLRRDDFAADPSAPLLRRYAAAAAILIGLGTAGAAWLGPNPAHGTMLSSGRALRMLETGQLVHHERLALTAYPQPAAPRPETER